MSPVMRGLESLKKVMAVRVLDVFLVSLLYETFELTQVRVRFSMAKNVRIVSASSENYRG